MVVITNVFISARRGGGSSLDILYGTVTFRPTLAHARSTSIVLPAPTTYDLVDGEVTAQNVQPTPEPNEENELAWAYQVCFADRHGKKYEFMVGVPDSTDTVNFTDLPRYYETKPPAYGVGPKGEQGEAATVQVGTVSSGATPAVTNSGTNKDAVLNFVLPKGDKGDKGDAGQAGEDGTILPDQVNNTALITNSSGEFEWRPFSANTRNPDTVVVRQATTGTVHVGEPTADTHAVTKGYLHTSGADLRGAITDYLSTQGWGKVFYSRDGAFRDRLEASGDTITYSTYNSSKGEFGAFEGAYGRGIVPSGSGVGTNRIMIIAEYVQSNSPQTLFSTGAGGVSLVVQPDGELTAYHPLPHTGPKINPGKYIFEVEFDNFFVRFRVSGRFAHESHGITALKTGASWSLGGAYSGATNLWLGSIGAVLMGEDIDSKSLNRSRKTLMKLLPLEDPGLLTIDPQIRILVHDEDGRVVMRQGAENFRPAHSMASITKTINALVIRELFTDAELDNDVTITAEDIFPGPSNLDTFQVGDIFTIRELLSLALSPSNDSAPRTLARVGGQRLPGSLPPRAKFVRRMQDLADTFTPRPAVVMNVRASSMISTAQGLQIAKIIAEDPVLTECSSRPIGYTVTPRGPNSREIFCTQGFYGLDIDYRVFHSGKGGSVGTTWKHYLSNIVLDGKLYHTALFSSHESMTVGIDRSPQVGAMIDDVRCENYTISDGSMRLLGAEIETSGRRDITELFPNVTRSSSSPEPGIFIERVGHTVKLDILYMNFPSGTYSPVAVIPSGFTPGYRVRSTLAQGASLESRALLVLTTGQIFLTGLTSGEVSGTVTWDVSWLSLEPSSIPGYPADYWDGTDP